jgi:2-keto-3-deoxy-L-rhamnonate aldolase RhmA
MKRNNQMQTSFKERLGRSTPLVGPLMTLPSPEVAEILARTGFDWLFVDLEHGGIDLRAARHILQAVDNRIPCVVRTPSLDEVWIKACLDLGPAGIILPQVRTPGDAREAIERCHYPPLGCRSVGIARAQGYGMDLERCLARANDHLALIVQIEHVDAVQNIDTIVSLEGIDALLVGPYDLSASMGAPGQIQSAEFQKAVARVAGAARRADIAMGIFGATPGAVKPYMDRGFGLLAVGTDTLLLGTAAKQLLTGLEENRRPG